MREVFTKIEIQAPADVVWSILTDFTAYHLWNPLITQARGEAVVGQRLETRAKISRGRGMVFRPLVTRVVPGRELRWFGHLLLPGLCDGEHIFEIEPSGTNCVRFVHRQIFKGLLLSLLWPFLAGKTRNGFVRMNEALKERSEERRKSEDTLRIHENEESVL